MKEIILLILFTYPGAIAEITYAKLAVGRNYFKKKDDIARVATNFFASVLVTAVSSLTFRMVGKTDGSIAQLADSLVGTRLFLTYAILSFAVSVALGLAWFGIREIVFMAQNRKKDIKLGKFGMTWSELLQDKDIPYKDCVMAIYQGKELIRAGVAYICSDDLKADPGITLAYTDLVQSQLAMDRDERQLLGIPVVAYVDTSTGITVDIYNGDKVKEYIEKEWS